MFHGTNFTESSASYESLDLLMKAASMMGEYAQQAEEGPDRDALIAQFANNAYMGRRGLTQEDLPKEGFIDDEHMTIWNILANRAQWLTKWGELAYPRIQTSHSFAAQLMATTVSRREIPFIEAPWPAFMIEVPAGLLPIESKDGVLSEITRIHVNSSYLPSLWTDPPWWGLELTGKGIEIHRTGRLVEAFDQPTGRILKNKKLMEVPDSYRIQERDLPLGDDIHDFWEGYNHHQESRVAILAARLTLGACIMMTDKANYREKSVRLDPMLANVRRRLGKEPTSQVYTLGKPVKVDFRLAVREYLRGSLRSLTVQSLVAGHHKHQPHGPGSSLRKWTFIEPYWRGPQDGPIVVRPHMVDE